MLSYAITVCNEARELDNLLTFLNEVKRVDDEIVILVDSNNTSEQVENVLKTFENVKRFERPFNRDFADHKNHLATICSGEYIFNIDADEIPQEFLVKMIERMTDEAKHDLIWVPRINICPGYTQAFIKKHKFSCNDMGWINWPDYQGRVYKKTLKWGGVVHEKIEGASNPIGLKATPHIALWHIKSVSKQNKQNELYDTIST